MKNIETNPDRIRRQQAILAHLGYYRGSLDGVWSGESIRAKKDFEASGKFTGGIPNQGLPFDPTGPLPAPLYKDVRSGLICHPELTDEKLQEMMKQRGETDIKVKEPTVKREPETDVSKEQEAPVQKQEAHKQHSGRPLSNKDKRRQQMQRN